MGDASYGHVLKLLESFPNTSFHENGAADGAAVGVADGESDGDLEGVSLGAIEGESDGAIPNKTSPIIPSNVFSLSRPFKNFFSNVGITNNVLPYALLSFFTMPLLLDFRLVLKE